ncbi:hypothetical protein WMY93_024936 [Mugilogobius chulae]|uniref:Uncharacterized protein n=1 Tax=Mugilogobius chulae TaxID=88201 RepID=A0AAW0N146_9GOBI
MFSKASSQSHLFTSLNQEDHLQCDRDAHIHGSGTNNSINITNRPGYTCSEHSIGYPRNLETFSHTTLESLWTILTLSACFNGLQLVRRVLSVSSAPPLTGASLGPPQPVMDGAETPTILPLQDLQKSCISVERDHADTTAFGKPRRAEEAEQKGRKDLSEQVMYSDEGLMLDLGR